MRIVSITAIITVFISTISYAQPAGYKKVQDVHALQTSLTKTNSQLNNISSDFKQVKNMSLLEEKLQSRGKFYFEKEFKVRIEYIAPYSYLMVMNGNKMYVKDEQKSNTINTGNSKMMQSLNRVIVDCMSGSVFSNPDFSVTAYSNTKQYMLKMVPNSGEMKKLFEQIEVYMDTKDLKVQSLLMTENGGDYTSMNFYNIQHNTQLNESLFKIK